MQKDSSLSVQFVFSGVSIMRALVVRVRNCGGGWGEANNRCATIKSDSAGCVQSPDSTTTRNYM